MEHVGPAQDGERGQVAAEAPPADGDAAQVEPRILGGEREQAVDLVLQHRVGQVAVDRRAPTRCRGPGVPRPSITTTAKPWSANHCEVR